MKEQLTFELKTGTLTVKINKIKNDYKFDELFGVGSRINKKRGFVFVSKVLGKHFPSNPESMEFIHYELSDKIFQNIHGQNSLIIGFAETAVGIGQGVYDKLEKMNKSYFDKNTFLFQHSTRYLTNNTISMSFEEEHCHAPSHIFYEFENSDSKDILNNLENIVLIDDEVSTGNTSINFIKELHKKYPNVKNFNVISILNCMNEKQNKMINDFVKENQIFINFISLVEGEFDFEPNNLEIDTNINSICSAPYLLKDKMSNILKNNYGRYGIDNKNINLYNYMNIEEIEELKDKNVLVLGTGEFMHIPFLVAKQLSLNNINTFVQSTTRSPLNIDNEIKSVIRFKDNYFENIDNFLYNVIDKNYDLIIVCYETSEIPEEHKLIEILEGYNFKTKTLLF
jgi:hypothetical protein